MGLSGSIRLWSQLIYFRLRHGSPRRYPDQWESYWRSVHATGRGGEVLWDNVPERASAEDLRRFAPHLDPALPLLDLGCGNGRQARFLARRFSRVIGADVAPAAIALARREARELAEVIAVDYRVLDATRPEQAAALHAEVGDVNIYMRGVLHVIAPADRRRFAESLAILLGEHGTLYDIELTSAAFAFFRSLVPGDSPSGLPWLVHNVVRHGPRPHGFDLGERPLYFPEERWEVIDEGAGVTIKTVPLSHGAESLVPACYMVLRPQHRAARRPRHPGHRLADRRLAERWAS
jgi:SAM-dependent methyltransferase